MKFTKKNIPLNTFQSRKIKKILTEDDYQKFLLDSNDNYIIKNQEKLIGFFSLKVCTDKILLTCLYILDEYRNKSIATTVLNDIIFAVRHNFKKNIKYIIVNTFVDSCMFYLKKGFNFCKINKKLDYKKKNIILMYKKINL